MLPARVAHVSYDLVMPTDADGDSWLPWIDTAQGPVDPTVAGGSVWGDVLPDPTPTGEIPVIGTGEEEPDEGATPFRHRGRRLWWVAALVLPVAIFVLGVSFIVAGLGLEWDSGGSSSAPPATQSLPMATAAINLEGDPAVATTDLVSSFASLLRAGRFDDAAVLTDGLWTSAILSRSYGPLDQLQTQLVSVQPIGPNEYRVRLVVLSVPIASSGEARARCEVWTVNPTVPRVVPAPGAQKIEDPTLVFLRGTVLTDGLARDCAARSMA